MTDIQRATAEFLNRVEALAAERMKGLLVGLLSELREGSQHWAGKIPLGSGKAASPSSSASTQPGEKRKMTLRTPEEKLRIVALAERVGVAEAMRRSGADRDSIRAWAKGESLGRPGTQAKASKPSGTVSTRTWTREQKLAAVKLAKKLDTNAAERRLNLASGVISNWKAGKFLGSVGNPNLQPKAKPKQKYRSYSPAEREKIIAYAKEHNAADAARKFKMKTASLVRNWMNGKNLGTRGVKPPEAAPEAVSS